MSTDKSHDMRQIMFGCQMRAARALVNWTAQQLADASKVGVATIRRAEVSEGPVRMTAVNSAAVRVALETAGIVFIPENGGGPGARLRERTPSA